MGSGQDRGDVCDVWDQHHSINAVRRVKELAPRIDKVLKTARTKGTVIIHAPSDCMDNYAEHVARKRAIDVPLATPMPADIGQWCNRIKSEESAVYPLDQSDGGDDDDPAEHAAWANELKAMGRNPGTPWKSQSSLITIDSDRDYISDKGEEVWSILKSRGITNVILVGVHTNMCVLGRPFGLRQMARNGKRVALMRDLTDTMYNPRQWPFVNHHTGTDLIVEYIEQHICPTLTSDQLLGGQPFRFTSDQRPLVAIVMAEDEYETNQTLPRFAADYLGKDFRVAQVFGSETDPNDIPGLEILRDADAALLSIRRRVLPSKQMDIFRQFVQAGKPVIGIRIASHAFSLREGKTPQGLESWPEFDAQVFGGNYSGHHGNAVLPTIELIEENASDYLVSGIEQKTFAAGGSLYKTSPLAKTARPLLVGSIAGENPEPVAWTFERADGGRSFYTSLGHKQDFANPAFVRLLLNSVSWGTGREITVPSTHGSLLDKPQDYWRVVSIPCAAIEPSPTAVEKANSCGWYRCFVKIENQFPHPVVILRSKIGATAWWNGFPLARASDTHGGAHFSIPTDRIDFGELNLLVVCCENDETGTALTEAPLLVVGEFERSLCGKWQFRAGSDSSWSSLTLPPKFAAAPDVVFE